MNDSQYSQLSAINSLSIPAGYKQTEVGVIPENWDFQKIESIISEISMGPFGSDIKVSNFVSDGVPVLSGVNVRSERLIDSFINFVSPAKAKSLKKAVAHQGDIVVTHRGTLGQISYIPKDSAYDSYVISQSQFRMRINESLVTPSWVVLYFHSERGAESLLEGKGHTGVPAIAQPTKTFRQLHIPLPPLHEQRAIAEALSDADAFIESLEQLIAKKRHIKQGAMQELLTGKKRLPGFSGEWVIKSLGEIGDSLIGLTYKPSDVRTDGVLVLRSSNVFEGALRFEDNVFVEMEIPERIIIKLGDILICVRNGSRELIGKCAKINENVEGMTFGAFMAVFRTPFHNFVFHQFQSDVIKRQIHEHLGATINQITNKSLNSFQIPFPLDETEQNAIASILSDMDAEIDTLETKLTKARHIKQGMMHNLLTGKIRLV